MLTAVNLNDHLQTVTGEVDNVVAKPNLPSKVRGRSREPV
jgi:hypothetical protein